ncbi:DUF2384 domain-containing protein [Corallincola holothuriorum]|uniref:DUF2384 domain-containing protein n=2 Tax=Corallincola holothuriorum TaxID=2282215 RepID=A0A368N838_9GAMM|nr:DUF2384 domain-containing protein [Corallincola holothuriorum]
MSGFCGDLGYQELSRLRSKLDSAQQSEWDLVRKRFADLDERDLVGGDDYFESLNTQELGALLLTLPGLCSQLMAIFKEPEAANRWLITPKSSLQGRTPLECLPHETELVVDMLERMRSCR